MKELTQEGKKALLKRSHELRPVVMIGNKGLTEAVNKEIDIALNVHELIKIKIAGQDREQRSAVLKTISETHQAHLIQEIGMIGLFYRKSEEE